MARQVGIDRMGPGIIWFYWKVSSQLGDYPPAGSGRALEFFIDGVRQARISGTTDWQGQPAVSLARELGTATGFWVDMGPVGL